MASGPTKTFRVPVRDRGREPIRSLFNRQFQEVEAVKAIDFESAPGSGCPTSPSTQCLGVADPRSRMNEFLRASA